MRYSFTALALALVASSAVSATLPALGGVNIAGLEFGISTDGSSGSYQAPPVSQIAHFSGKGANLFRIPFGWQYLTPTLGGSADATYLALIDTYVQAALTASSDTYVLLDLHNYARWNGAIIGSGGPTDAEFASLWKILAAKYASETRVIYGLMNEPHDMSSVSAWVTSNQAAVTAIRDAGAVGTILLAGTEWSHISNLISTSGPALVAGVTDSLNNLAFDVHAYLDSDGSGTQSSCTTDNVDLLTQLTTWLKSVGMQAILSETGVPNNSDCITKFNAQLAYVASVPDQIAGFTVWSAGSFATDYLLSITPSGDTDNAVATGAVIPNFPTSSSAAEDVLAVVTSSSAPVSSSVQSSAPVSSSVQSSLSVVVPSSTSESDSSCIVRPTASSVYSSAKENYSSAKENYSSAIPASSIAAALKTSSAQAVQTQASSSSAVLSSAAPSSSSSAAAQKFSTVIRSSSSSVQVQSTAVVSSAAASSTASSSSALGGVAVPIVTANSDGSYTVGSRSDFKNSADAANYACDSQHNSCATAANKSGSTFTVNQCDVQMNTCKSSTTSSKRSHLNWARQH